MAVDVPDRTERAISEMFWDTVLVLGGEVQDTLLLRPRAIAAGPGRLYAYDYGDDRLKAFDSEGEFLWAFGGPGEGPDEFGNPFDIEVAPDADVWVVDAGSGRLTAVSPAGERVRTVNLRSMARDVMPLEGRLLVAPVGAQDILWRELDDAGETVASGGLPLAEWRDADPSARQPRVALAANGETWSAIFPFGDLFVVYRGTERVCAGRLIEGEPLREEPGPSADLPVFAVDAVIADASVFVLARGESEDALRVLDRYSLPECRYRETLRLPRTFRTMAHADGTFYFEHEDPVPTIMGLQPGAAPNE